jgi:two-component system, NtrC family, nitrogen regulation sensor histidine kinase NtrY
MTLRTRITIAMISIVLLSLLVIGAVTIWFFNVQNEKYHEERLQRKERAIKTEMGYFSREVEIQGSADIVMKEFEEEVLRLATIHNLEINVFNNDGEMLVSARPDSIHSEYVHKKVPYSAYEELDHINRVVIPETEGTHNYLSDYTNLKNAKGERIGILNIPYSQDEERNEKDIQEFLRSIGIVYIFLFIGAMIITILLSNSITRNLAWLSQRIQNVDLNKKNESIEWRGDDELGSLVDAYNVMLQKLEESRVLLAKTERESAWREMAKQVAHEIKNPLTPIKLSIQHLQATASFEDDAWREKFKKTMGMIIEQIESLNKIATEFSDFAKMPKANPELTNLSKAVESAYILFSEQGFSLECNIEQENIECFIDSERFGRVLNNLIKNAKQAVQDSENATVSIGLTTKIDVAILTVTDNGKGIPDEIKPKIFQPNFTTKSSGTGLGLAISQQIIDQAGGYISFTSTPSVETTFRVELPIRTES